MSERKRLAITAFVISVKAPIIAVGIFAAVYFEFLDRASYIWVGVVVLASQLPALVMGIASRRQYLGRAALALSSSILISLIVALLVVGSLSASEGTIEDAVAIQEEIGTSFCAPARYHERNSGSTVRISCLLQEQQTSGGVQLHA